MLLLLYSSMHYLSLNYDHFNVFSDIEYFDSIFPFLIVSVRPRQDLACGILVFFRRFEELYFFFTSASIFENVPMIAEIDRWV